MYFITWTKLVGGDNWTRVYLFAEGTDKPLRDLVGRARFTIDKKKARLDINDLRYGDESIYKCDVTYVVGRCPSLTFVQLNIIGSVKTD